MIARETVPAVRKDVLTTRAGKTVGGGDVTRKMKLLAKQREGKKRMKHVGKIALGQDVFLALMKK